MKMIFALAAASLAVLSAPAVLAMGQTQTVPQSNQPVSAQDRAIAARFNSCVSAQYSAKANRTSAVNNAMGKYRDEFTLVGRADKANNLPEFRRYLSSSAALAVPVGTTCVLGE